MMNNYWFIYLFILKIMTLYVSRTINYTKVMQRFLTFLYAIYILMIFYTMQSIVLIFYFSNLFSLSPL